MIINYNGAKIEIDLKNYSDEKILSQRKTAIELQEMLMTLFEKSPEEMNNSQLPDWNELCDNISDMERELEQRGYYENVDTGDYLKDDDNDE